MPIHIYCKTLSTIYPTATAVCSIFPRITKVSAANARKQAIVPPLLDSTIHLSQPCYRFSLGQKDCHYFCFSKYLVQRFQSHLERVSSGLRIMPVSLNSRYVSNILVYHRRFSAYADSIYIDQLTSPTVEIGTSTLSLIGRELNRTIILAAKGAILAQCEKDDPKFTN